MTEKWRPSPATACFCGLIIGSEPNIAFIIMSIGVQRCPEERRSGFAVRLRRAKQFPMRQNLFHPSLSIEGKSQ
jgi:hypothetical protein